MPRKLTIEQVREFVESQEYRLLTDEYKGNRVKLPFECPQGHKFEMILSNFKDVGARCPECKKEIISKQRRNNYNDIRKIAESRGYKLLKYNSTHSVEVECPVGHNWKTTLDGIKNHHCLYCSNRAPVNFLEIKKFFEENGCTLISTEHNNSRDKLKYMCLCGNISETYWSAFKKGHRCKECGYRKISEKALLSQEEVESYFKDKNCKLISEYKGSHEKIRYICECGNEAECIFSNFVKGARCMFCAEGLKGYGMQFEKLVKEVFDSLKYDYHYQYTGFKGFRPDFYDEINNHIIDAKLSRWTIYQNKADIEKYKPYCDKLSVVYLRHREIEDDIGVEFIHIKSYYPELVNIGRADLIYEIEKLEKQIEGD